MENRFRSLFLALLVTFSGLFSNALLAAAHLPPDSDLLIAPDVERQAFDDAQIDSSDFELMLFAGFLSIEDFGVNALVAFKLNYYVNESIFVQLSLAQSEGSETSYEVLSGGAPLLTDDERQLQYYSINIGYNLLPGEAFLGEQTAFNTALYLSAGIGNTDFAGSERFTINYGAGYRFLLNDAISLNTEFRNNVFDVDVFGKKTTSNNLEFIVGIGWFF
ncbi:MAG: outer membrane beta-barrel domain-containing protein [Gammaproteobacteria bacterium]|nr:outer membrane beta-barrel domain-containing protein [Gammaproteobacteria bacterium]MBL6998513.1 outer membrane beta-barrel domain-containing protein [Gammaproteobacteria bacterium]